MDVIFTIVSRNYAAQAATLMQSLAEAEPDARRVVIATDGPIPQLEALAEVIAAETLDAPLAAMSVYYDALELNTAVKPYAFRRLLAEADSVTYLDPDIYVYRPLTEVRAALEAAELALTPHLTRPLAGEALPNDQAILTSGVYNLGFMAARATPKVLALVAWWAERCRFDCRVDFAAGLFTDQRWMDLAPGFVDQFAILRDPALNLAYWNLEGRTLARAPGGWTVDGQPLAFFHFSGFDPARPDVLSKHQDRTAVTAGAPLAALLADYARALLANGHAQARAIEYAHARFPSGQPVTREMRLRALAAARAGEDFSAGLTARTEARLTADGVRREADPDAEASSGDLLAWLRGVDARGRPRALTALLAARADLRDRFAKDSDGLIAWVLGVEAPAGRFAPDLLRDTFVAELARDPELPLRAARFAAPEASTLHQRLSAAFGLSARGRWPDVLARPLRAPLLAPAPGLPAPFPQLFQDIWRSRTDLQRQFPLRTRFQRFRYLRWLVGGGLAAYDVPADQLPAHPLLSLAKLSVGGAPAPAAPRRPAAELWVIEDPEEALEAAADRRVYVASTGQFLGPVGVAEPPSRVGVVRFLTRPALIPADAMALHARGVRWDAVAGPGE
ncbi:MAG: hypothetical protein JWP49_2737 [Phenylobacterium sp.]|nr:hypothetical protein [Phenylobacterium sp.]